MSEWHAVSPFSFHVPERRFRAQVSEVTKSLRWVLQVALPIVLQAFITYGPTFTTIVYIGHRRPEDFSALALALSYYYLTGLSILGGLCQGMDAICGQAFAMGEYKTVGLTLQRALITSGMLCVPIFILWVLSEDLLIALHQDPTLSSKVHDLLIICPPLLILDIVLLCIGRYLTYINLTVPHTLATITGLLLSPLFCWMFVDVFDFGVKGAPMAMTLVYLVDDTFILCWLYWSSRMRGSSTATWHGWSLEALSGLGSYLIVATPALVVECVEWWSFELVVFISGYLPNPSVTVGAMGMANSLFNMWSMIPLGISAAVGIRVAHEVAGRNVAGAKIVSIIGFLMNLVIMVGLATVFIVTRDKAGEFWTFHTDDVEEFADILVWVAVAQVGLGSSMVISAVLRGLMRQGYALTISLVSSWVIGLIGGIVVVFVFNFGVVGFWIAFAVSGWVQFICMLVVLACLDFKSESRRAQLLIQSKSAYRSLLMISVREDGRTYERMDTQSSRSSESG